MGGRGGGGGGGGEYNRTSTGQPTEHRIGHFSSVTRPSPYVQNEDDPVVLSASC